MALGAQRKTMAHSAAESRSTWRVCGSSVESIVIEEDFRWVFQIER